MIFIFYILHFTLCTLDTLYVYYTGDELYYDLKEEIIFLIGNATLTYGDVKVIADTIRYENKTKNIHAYGNNTTLWVGKQEIKSKNMKFNVETEKGVCYNAKTQVENGWFEGKVIRKVGEKELDIDYGKFTTCDLPIPHYYFWARELKVYLDDMVITRPVVLYIQDIPVFAVPYWFFPIGEKRRSGLLPPRVGISDYEGRYVKNISYYLVINDYADCTFKLDYIEKKGPKFGFEALYLVRPWVSGNFNASHIIEKEGKRRWDCNFVHQHKFGKNISIKANGDFISDTKYKRDYEEETIFQLDKRLTSYLSITKGWSFGSSGFALEEKRDLSTNRYVRLLPKVNFSLHDKEFLGAHFSYHNLLVNYHIPDTSHIGFDNKIGLSRPFKVLKFFNLLPAMGYSFTIYDRDKEGNKYPVREVSNYSLSLSTVLYGRSIFRNPELRHTMIPSISWSYTPKKDFGRFYSFGGIGGGSTGGKSLSFGLVNDFQCIFKGKKINIGNLNFSSSWNFDEERLNPICASLFITPISSFNIKTSATYNTTNNKVENIGITSILRFNKEGYSLNLAHHYRIEGAQSLRGEFSLPLTKHWHLTGSRMWDLKEKNLIEESFYLTRDLHCWVADLSYNRYGENRRYNFEVRIRKIPEIKVGKDIIGWLLP